ncbi:hypothetical protein [Paenibacillus sp. FSL M7-1046]|jgi:hypothetical protein|uniref:hypothetical protein n=1 Tax=Paenibacillus sp. FSL M7-1046 TaxID=2975315 RepID=UPI0030FC21AF
MNAESAYGAPFKINVFTATIQGYNKAILEIDVFLTTKIGEKQRFAQITPK